MLFPTIEFAVFFLVVFPIVWSLNRLNTLKKAFLVAASYYFYAQWDPWFLFLIVGSSVFNFGAALYIGSSAPRSSRKFALAATIAADLGVLGFFKYWNFLAVTSANLAVEAGLPLDPYILELALPIAISFFTFHVISYVVDVFKEKIPATRNLIDFLLYISFFPHLVAGPIVRATEFLPQLAGPRDPAVVRLGPSLVLIIGGLLKKGIVANYIAVQLVDPVFGNPGNYGTLDLALAVYGYAIQIYCDFSAYTDIAIGVANLLGYNFPQNFNQPYRALSVGEFWNRWHITLSRWLRDYLYIPLGGNRGGTLATCRNLIITMTLGGLWHGAGFNFILWGVMHGVVMAAERLIGIGARDERPRAAWAIALRWFVTFHIISFAWIFFRSASLDDALLFLRSFGNTSIETTLATPAMLALILIGALTQIVPRAWIERLEARFEVSPVPVKIAMASVAMVAVLLAWPGEMAPFIYFQF